MFKGFSVDERLREFRKVTWEKGEPSIEYIPFESKKGSELLKGLLRSDLPIQSRITKEEGRFVVRPKGSGGSPQRGSPLL